MGRVYLLLLWWLAGRNLMLYGAEAGDTLLFRVVSYNTENLFDCRDDSLKADEEFLPDAVRHWTPTKYRKKLDAIGRVVVAAGGDRMPPALVALCEVENDSVLTDLTRRSLLREAGYRYVMTHSPDVRGIDVALLYQRHLFKPVACQSLLVAGASRNHRPTRDILHVSGRLLNSDTLDVFVVHFPSRSGGAKQSEPRRLAAARRLRRATDSLFLIRRHPQILVLGDFNDYPRNASIRQVLQAEAPSSADDIIEPHRLYHLLADKAATRKGYGSYKYQGAWGLLDHILVSGTLLQPSSTLHTAPSMADVFAPSFLLTDDPKYGGVQPLRSYVGMKYQEGYSDHLPVFADFIIIY